MAKNLHNRAIEPFFCDLLPEVRSVAEGDGIRIFGYWAVFNRLSRELSTDKGVRFVERILPGAFDETDFSDAESRFNHSDYLSSAPNLRYGVDATGAWYEYDHDPHDANHVATLRRIERREIKGSSFQFPPLPKDAFTVSEHAPGVKLRTIIKFPRVLEFGPVITPAYPSSSAFARSLDEAAHQEELALVEQQQLEQQEQEQRQQLQQIRLQQFRALLQ